MTKSELLTHTANVFPEGPPPAKGDVLSKGCYPGDPESEDIEDFFGGRPWKSITPGDVFNFRPALCFFSPRALAYYTAAWMICSLLDEEAVDTAPDDLVSAFERSDPTLWTVEQRRVICEWLKHFMDEDVPWHKVSYEKAAKKLSCDWNSAVGEINSK